MVPNAETRLVVRLDPESELLVLLSHAEKVIQALLEFLWPVPGSSDECDSDALIWPRVALEVSPGPLIRFQCFPNVGWNLKRFGIQVPERFEHVCHYFLLLDEPSQPFLIGL